jgi:hypothetical protein
MIVIYCQQTKSRLSIDGVVRNNSSQWFLIGIGMGFETCTLLINAESESEAMDIYADSRYGHLTEIELKEMKDYLDPNRKKAIELMQQIEDSASDAIHQLEHEHDYRPFDFDSVYKDIKDWADECESIEWDDHYQNITYLGNEGKPHQLDELRLFECIPKSQIHWFHPKCDLIFHPKRNQVLDKTDFIR